MFSTLARVSELSDLLNFDRHQPVLFLAYREPDPVPATQIRRVEQAGRLGEEGHRLHLVHEARHRVVADHHQGTAPARVEDPGDAIETPSREGRPVAPPDAGGEAGEEEEEERGDRYAPERYRGNSRGSRRYSMSSLGGTLPATCSGVSTQVPPQPSLKVALAARKALPSVMIMTPTLANVPRPQTMALPGT